jgi:hypothetical protein
MSAILLLNGYIFFIAQSTPTPRCRCGAVVRVRSTCIPLRVSICRDSLDTFSSVCGTGFAIRIAAWGKILQSCAGSVEHRRNAQQGLDIKTAIAGSFGHSTASLAHDGKNDW